MFSSYIKERALRKREMEIELKEESFKDFEATYQRGLKDKVEYECHWHNEHEKKKVELALLDAKIEERKVFLEKSSLLQSQIDSGRDREISILKDVCNHQKEIINQLTNTMKEFKPQPVTLHSHEALRISQ